MIEKYCQVDPINKREKHLFYYSITVDSLIVTIVLNNSLDFGPKAAHINQPFAIFGPPKFLRIRFADTFKTMNEFIPNFSIQTLSTPFKANLFAFYIKLRNSSFDWALQKFLEILRR